jgi:hypothetical protein
MKCRFMEPCRRAAYRHFLAPWHPAVLAEPGVVPCQYRESGTQKLRIAVIRLVVYIRYFFIQAHFYAHRVTGDSGWHGYFMHFRVGALGLPCCC